MYQKGFQLCWILESSCRLLMGAFLNIVFYEFNKFVLELEREGNPFYERNLWDWWRRKERWCVAYACEVFINCACFNNLIAWSGKILFLELVIIGCYEKGLFRKLYFVFNGKVFSAVLKCCFCSHCVLFQISTIVKGWYCGFLL